MNNNKHNNQTTLMGCDTIEMNLVMKFFLMGYAQHGLRYKVEKLFFIFYLLTFSSVLTGVKMQDMEAWQGGAKKTPSLARVDFLHCCISHCKEVQICLQVQPPFDHFLHCSLKLNHFQLQNHLEKMSRMSSKT